MGMGVVTHGLVLAIDPGTTTGLAVLECHLPDVSAPTAIWSEQLDWDKATEAVAWWLERLRHSHDIDNYAVAAVCEKFQINPQTARKGQQGAEDALGMIGVVRRECRLTHIEFVPPQQASAAKNMVKDDTLKSLNLYSPGLSHCNDAYRHALLHAVKAQWVKAWRLL